MTYPIAQPDLLGNEQSYVKQALDSGWVSSQGPFISQFEGAFAKYIGTEYAIACSSGTTALTLALAALGIKEGDEVIVPEFTMVATAWAVSYLGATPVFVDCGDNLNIDISRIEEVITPRTRAIIPVHVYGRPANMPAIMEIAHDYNLWVIEDAAEAHGAFIPLQLEPGKAPGGVGKPPIKRVGSWGDIGCFSLYANKIITSGEGGIAVTKSERLYRQMKHLANMAFSGGHTFLHKKLGYNYRMTNVQAALALAQLERIDTFIHSRQEIRKWYDAELENSTYVSVIERPPGSVLWMYDVVFRENAARELAMQRLARKGIETRYFFKPMSRQPMYHAPYQSLRAFDFSERGCYLPAYTALAQKDVKFICNALEHGA